MAIRGYYKSWPNPLSAPYAEVRVELPRLGTFDKIEFLIDTGSDVTCLHPSDAGKLGLSLDRIRPGDSVGFTGVGGSLEYRQEDAILYFADQDGSVLRFFCDIHFSLHPATERLPSLLGRDFLNRCSLLADYPENRALITPANVISGVILPA